MGAGYLPGARRPTAYNGAMKVWIVTENLFWSARLLRSVRAMGHEAADAGADAVQACDGDWVLLDLSSLCTAKDVAGWKASGATVVGFAGHKEQEKLATGKEMGCDEVVSNSTITNLLDRVIRT